MTKVKENWLYITLGILVLADGIITNLIIGSGIGHEGNGFLLSLAGTNWLIVAKILGICAVVYLLRRDKSKFARYTTIGCIVFSALVVFWNIGVVLRA